jgi:parallel beta-helix repeat protein
MGQAQFEKALQTQLILTSDGDLIELEAGNFQISGSLSLEGKKKITIRGKGMDKTVLSFKDQKTGAEGIKITNCENIVLEDLTVQDSKGDLIKTMHVKDITFRRIKAEWTGGPKAENGSYALYPVLCTNILIDSCISIGASDAGIYVGQSQHIEVKNCTAFQNVAGIEIENSLMQMSITTTHMEIREVF